MRVELDRAAGLARLCAETWSQVVPIAALPGQLAFYRRLWSRGAKAKGAPGPWARHYAASVAALEAAVRECGRG